MWIGPRPDPLLREVPVGVHGGPEGQRAASLPAVSIDLSTNVNPYLPDPDVLDALGSADIGRYPDPDAVAPRRALASVWDLDPKRIHLGPGAAELIHRIARAYLLPGSRVVIAGPTFGEYARATRLRGAEPLWVRGDGPHLRLPLDEIRRTIHRVRPTLLFLCSPNNPTGERVSPEAVARLVDELPTETLLVLDESYRSFSEGYLAPPHLPASDRVVHLRSFTKDLALPGLRVAAAIGAPAIMRTLARAAPPWPVSTVAQDALLVALRPGPLARLRTTLGQVAKRREALTERLRQRGWRPLSSTTGYVLSRVEGAEALCVAMRERGVSLRHASSFGLRDYIRVGVGLERDEAAFLDVLGELSNE